MTTTMPTNRYGTLATFGAVQVCRSRASTEAWGGERYYYPATMYVRIPDGSIMGWRQCHIEGRLTIAAFAAICRVANALDTAFGSDIGRANHAAVRAVIKSNFTPQEN